MIFRATEQWFVDLEKSGDDIRGQAGEAIRRTRWIPACGAERIGGMVENRHEWCVSRQRRWGSPITVVYCTACRAVFPDANDAGATRAFFEQVVAAFREAGGDAWFDAQVVLSVSGPVHAAFVSFSSRAPASAAASAAFCIERWRNCQ